MAQKQNCATCNHPSWRKLFAIHASSGHTEGHPCSQDKGPFEEPKHEIQPMGRASVAWKTTSSSAGGLCEGEYGIRESPD